MIRGRPPAGEPVEALLEREHRAALPLGRQLLLYLNPFALYKDASRGPLWARQHALAYNRARRAMLLPYLRRWALVAAALFAAISPAEVLASQVGVFVVPAAAVAVGCCIAIAVCAVIGAVYLLLGARRE